MASVQMQAFPGFSARYSEKSLFVSVKTYEKYTVSKEHCTAQYDDKLYFLPNCRFHILQTRQIEEEVQIFY